MKWLKEYIHSLKSLHAEEYVDIYFFRPPAYFIIKLFFSLPLTPNHYSLFSLVSGLSASYFFLRGGPSYLKIGACFFLLSSILDCCDGMLARLKKNGSPFGKIIDGVVDYIVNLAVFISLTYALSQSSSHFLYFPIAYLLPIAGLSKIFHSWIYDYYLTKFLNCEEKKIFNIEDEILKIKKLMPHQENNFKEKFKKGSLLIYIGYLKAQKRACSTHCIESPELYCQINLKNIRYWSYIGPSMHNFLLIFFLLLGSIYPYLLFSIIVANLWGIKMIYSQKKSNQFIVELINKRGNNV
jgi:hypothetical protein